MKKNNKNIPNDMKNLQHLYDPNYDITQDYNYIVDTAKKDRNIRISAGTVCLIAAGASYILSKSCPINGLDVVTICTSFASTLLYSGALLDQSTINKEKKKLL